MPWLIRLFLIDRTANRCRSWRRRLHRPHGVRWTARRGVNPTTVPSGSCASIWRHLTDGMSGWGKPAISSRPRLIPVSGRVPWGRPMREKQAVGLLGRLDKLLCYFSIFSFVGKSHPVSLAIELGHSLNSAMVNENIETRIWPYVPVADDLSSIVLTIFDFAQKSIACSKKRRVTRQRGSFKSAWKQRRREDLMLLRNASPLEDWPSPDKSRLKKAQRVYRPSFSQKRKVEKDWCPVTRRYWSRTAITTGHLFPHRSGEAAMEAFFGHSRDDQGVSEMNKPENGMIWATNSPDGKHTVWKIS